MVVARVAQHRVEQRQVSVVGRHEPAKSGVRPDHRRSRVCRQQREQIVVVRGTLPFPHPVDVAVENRDQPDLGRRLKDAVEGGIAQARRVARDLGGHELLVHAELADTREHAGESQQHAPDVVRSVHVRRVEAGDHRVHARPVRRVQRQVLHGDRRVDERVVIERRVGEQVVVGRAVAGDEMIPLLLQRNAEHGDPADPVADDLEVPAGRDASLHVVCQVEVDVVEARRVPASTAKAALFARVRRQRALHQATRQQQAEAGANTALSPSRQTATTSGNHKSRCRGATRGATRFASPFHGRESATSRQPCRLPDRHVPPRGTAARSSDEWSASADRRTRPHRRSRGSRRRRPRPSSSLGARSPADCGSDAAGK